jgi:NDP-sugar pyrophosphorylase family protein
MKAVIFAAGFGTRMHPLTEKVPKPMLNVAGKPILEYLLNNIPDKVSEIVFVVGYLGDQIEKYFGKVHNGKKIHYVKQDKPKGTWHALKICKTHLEGQRFLILHGDDLHSKENIERCLEYPSSLLVKHVKDPRKFGAVLGDKKGRLVSIIEKPSTNQPSLVSTGVMVLDNRIFKYPPRISVRGEMYLTDSLEQYSKKYHVRLVESSFWFPISAPIDLRRAEKYIKKTDGSQRH